MGNLPRSPCAPVGASSPPRIGLGAPPLFLEVGQYHGGAKVKSGANPIISNHKQYSFRGKGVARAGVSALPGTSATGVIAHSLEFVAKPQEADRIQAIVPAALTGVLKEVTGFAGCLVMASRYEARLVTVMTLWTGEDAQERCTENVRWIEAILKPYVDHRLRVQTLVAALPATLLHVAETSEDAAGSILEPPCPHAEEVCLA